MQSQSNIFIRISKRIDFICDTAGKVSSYLNFLLVLLIVLSVVMRYLFNTSFIALDEVQYYCYSIPMLFGLAYLYNENGHIRVDVISGRLPHRFRQWIELIGCAILLIPWTLVALWYTWHFFLRSWNIKEHSIESDGLPAVYILKFILVLGFVLLFLQAVSTVIKKVTQLYGTDSNLIKSSSEADRDRN